MPQMEFVFTSAGDIGRGTSGLGPDAARSASATLVKESMKAFWAKQDTTISEWHQKKQQYIEHCNAEQAKSARQRLQEAWIEREKQIKKMTEERKAFEAEAKRKRDEEAREKNQRIHEQKLQIQRERIEARQQRELAKERELAQLREQRAELLEIRAAEAEAAAEMAQQHITKMRQWHDVCVARAKEEAERRFKEAQESVKTIKQRQKEKETAIVAVREEIVHHKADLVRDVKRTLQHGHDVVEVKREKEVREIATSVRKEAEQAEKEKKARLAAVLEQRARSAKALRDEQQQTREQYHEERRKAQEQLQREAKRQKELAKESIAEEERRKREEHQEYIQLMRELMSKKINSPSRSRPATMSPARQPRADEASLGRERGSGGVAGSNAAASRH